MPISFETFKQYAQTYNTIPIFEQLVFDAHTPLTAFYQFKDEPNYVFLEGVSPHAQHGRFSYLGLDPELTCECFSHDYKLTKNKTVTQHKGTTFDALNHLLNHYTYPPDCPDYFTGILGNLSYECIHHYETIAKPPIRELNTPDAAFMIPKTMLIFDKLYHTLTICITTFLDPKTNLNDTHLTPIYNQAITQLNKIKQKCMNPTTISPAILFNQIDNYDQLNYNINIDKDTFLNHVNRCKDYIEAGDIFQIQISRRASIDYSNDPFLLYRYLRNFNPSPLLFNIKLANYSLIGASPEILVNVEQNIMSIRPIAGTRKRYSRKQSESEIIEELSTDPKEKAEHIMLVDLARNDVGRACKLNSVDVKDLMIIEKYAHVIHMVSAVEGHLKPQYSAVDALKYGFPAGTVTGAPKIRAMEIIAELETQQREFYSGGVVFFDFKNNLKSALTIRSICVANGKAYTQAAGGIVADSIPEMEFKETENKMRSSLSAMAQCGDLP